MSMCAKQNTHAADGRFAGSAAGADAMPMSQALRAPALAALLQLTPIEPESGLRILELDTDWQAGASAVELADRCGGSVVSLSHSSRAVSRARAAHAADGRVQFRRHSLTGGWPAGGPYDLILAWPLMNVVPHAWVDQCTPGGRLLCPMFLHQPVGGFGLLRLTTNRPGQPGKAMVASMRPGARPDAVRWTLWPAQLATVDDGYLVRSSQPRLAAQPVAQEPTRRRATQGRHRHVG